MARCRHDFSGHREHVLRSVSPFIDALRHVAADTSQLTVISTHFQLIQVSFNNPPRLLIVNIHCRLATQRSSAPQIQALRLTAVRVIKCPSVCMYVCICSGEASDKVRCSEMKHGGDVSWPSSLSQSSFLSTSPAVSSGPSCTGHCALL